MRRAIVLLFAGCGGFGDIDVQVTTDVSCSVVSSAVVAWMHPGEPVTAAQTTTLGVCNAMTFGEVAIAPDSAASLEIVVATSTGGTDPALCLSNATPECIVARRIIAPTSSKLTLPIALEQACAGLVCDPTTTCHAGQCISLGP